MLKIRLQRIGKIGQAHFRVVLLEHTKKPKGKYQELLGSYNPHEKKMNVKMDRIEHWISNGAQLSPTVHNLLVNYKFWDKPKVQTWRPKKKEAAPEAPAAKAPEAKAEAAPAVETPAPEAAPAPEPTPTPEVVAEAPAETPTKEAAPEAPIEAPPA